MVELFSIKKYEKVNGNNFVYKLELCDKKNPSKTVKTIQLTFIDDNKNKKIDADDNFILKSDFWSNLNQKNLNLDADNFRQELTKIIPNAVKDSASNLDDNSTLMPMGWTYPVCRLGIKDNAPNVKILTMSPSPKEKIDIKDKKNNDIMAVYDVKFSNNEQAKIIFRDYNKNGKFDAGDSFELMDGESDAPINLDSENLKQKLAEVIPNAVIQDAKMENNTCSVRFGSHLASDALVKDKTIDGVILPPSTQPVSVSDSDVKKAQKSNLLQNSINGFANFVLSPIKNSTYKKFVQTLDTKKPELMSKLNIDSDTYNDLANLSTGIVEQETEFGAGLKYIFKENFQGCISFVKKRKGKMSFNSRGLSQMKIDSYTDPATRSLLAEYGINKNNLKNPEKSAIATLIVLAGMSKNELPRLKYRQSKLGLDNDDALLYLWNGKKDEITQETAIPSKNKYVLNVKRYASKNFAINQEKNYSSAINKLAEEKIENDTLTVSKPVEQVDTLPEIPDDFFSSGINNETKKAVTKPQEKQVKQVKQVDTLPEIQDEGW